MPMSDVYKQPIPLDDVLNPKLRKALKDLSREEHVPVQQFKLLGGFQFHDLDAGGQGDLVVRLPNGKEFFYKSEEDTMYPGDEK